MNRFIRVRSILALLIILSSANTFADGESQPTFRDSVLRVVQSNFEKLRGCFSEASSRKDKVIPKNLSALFRIGRYGNVQSVAFEESGEMSSELNQCIVSRISYLRFPAREADEKGSTRSVRLILNFGSATTPSESPSADADNDSEP